MPGRRILWWCNAFDPPTGGAELWAQQVVRRLRTLGHDQHVIAITDGAGPSRSATFEGMPLTVLHAAEGLADVPALSSLLARIEEILAVHRPEAVLVNNFGHASLALLGLARSRIRVPILLIAHNPWLEEAAVPGSPLDLAARRADTIITFEPHIAEWLGARWPTARIATLDHAMPPDDRPMLPLPEEPLLLFCGRLSEEKGPLVLIEALARLIATHPQARLTIAGSGHQRGEIEKRIAALGLDGHVRLAGGIAPYEVSALIDASFAVCVPSLIEGFGLTALEAAWRGRPVVASRVGGLPGLVADGETGLLAAPGDPAALAEVLAQMLDDPARAGAMGRAARTRAEARPGWEQHVARIAAIIEAMIDPAGERDARAALG